MTKLKCTGPECERERHGRQLLCKGHYQQQFRGQELRPIVAVDGGACDVQGCEEERVRRSKLCRAHNRMDWPLRKKYGITLLDRLAMAEAQGHVCAICGEAPGVPGDDGLVVDHCHDSGAVRGLLCPHCNHMLGHARDNQTTLSRAIDYLQATAC